MERIRRTVDSLSGGRLAYVWLQEHSTLERPHQLSAGVEQVFVNGVQVVRDGRDSGAKPGRIVRGAGWRGLARGDALEVGSGGVAGRIHEISPPVCRAPVSPRPAGHPAGRGDINKRERATA